ncbi:MAG: hypothetical protein JSW39_29730 [Desulfobacterales bacterium]|nr:MAG: hypothetical protein JSW39_29730 [Desulfobacterales bacterium]
MKRKSFNVFSLSFIDVITCGLGAIILLFVIVNAKSAARRKDVTQDLRGEVARLEQEVREGQRRLVEARNALDQTVQERVQTQGRARELIQTLEAEKIELADHAHDTLASREHVNKLQSDLKSLDEELQRLKAGSPSRDDPGDRLRPFPGHGDRQYLTDLKMGGDRIFILVDASASMLDDTIVGIIRRRNLTDKQKLQSVKWRQAVSTLDWLSTQLPPAARFQVYTFNETAAPLVPGTEGQWLNAGDPAQLNAVVDNLRRVVPQKGTSLRNAFEVLPKMNPGPDNIFLLTDGLPTIGLGRPWTSKVSGKRRLALFNDALRRLPPGVPVNIILYPLEGDPAAASAYWRLATSTRGSFFCPARDWP